MGGTAGAGTAFNEVTNNDLQHKVKAIAEGLKGCSSQKCRDELNQALRDAIKEESQPLQVAYSNPIATEPGSAWSAGGSSAAYTTHGIAPGSAYATYEQQNKMNFLVLAGTAALPAGGYGLLGPAVGDAMLVSGGIAGGFDAAGQYAQNCAQGNCKVSAINPVQSLFAVNSAMVAGPMVGPAGSQLSSIFRIPNSAGATISSGLFGAGVGYVNTSFNNAYNESSYDAIAASKYGSVAGMFGSIFGMGVLRWTGSAVSGSVVNNTLSNLPSFLPTPSIDGRTTLQGSK